MDLVPDAGQISQVMSQAAGPAFVLGAVAGSVQSFSHIWFGLSGARQWLKR
jgi:hypothetical protein